MYGILSTHLINGHIKYINWNVNELNKFPLYFHFQLMLFKHILYILIRFWLHEFLFIFFFLVTKTANKSIYTKRACTSTKAMKKFKNHLISIANIIHHKIEKVNKIIHLKLWCFVTPITKWWWWLWCNQFSKFYSFYYNLTHIECVKFNFNKSIECFRIFFFTFFRFTGMCSFKCYGCWCIIRWIDISSMPY